MSTQFQANYSANTACTVTPLVSLASSATLVAGAYLDFVDNRTTGYTMIYVYAKITGGTNALAGLIAAYALRADFDVPIAQDNITQPTGGAWTINNASPVASVVGPTNTTNGTYTLVFSIPDPGPWWAPGFAHTLTAALNATAGNFLVSWRGERIVGS